MDLVTLPFRLPFLPIQGLVRLAGLIQEEAEGEYRDPAAVRRQLEDAGEAYQRGEISSERMYQAQVEAINRAAAPSAGGTGGEAGAPGAAAAEASMEEE